MVSRRCLRVREKGHACRSEIVVGVHSYVPSASAGGDARAA
jgi:hypothetical protein